MTSLRRTRVVTFRNTGNTTLYLARNCGTDSVPRIALERIGTVAGASDWIYEACSVIALTSYPDAIPVEPNAERSWRSDVWALFSEPLRVDTSRLTGQYRLIVDAQTTRGGGARGTAVVDSTQRRSSAFSFVSIP